MSRRGAGVRLSPGAFYSTSHICLSQMEEPSYTSPRLEQNCDTPTHIKTTRSFEGTSRSGRYFVVDTFCESKCHKAGYICEDSDELRYLVANRY